MNGQGPALPLRQYRKALDRGDYGNFRLFDWVWHVKGSLALAPGQTSDDAFDRLEPLFRQTGTSHDRTGNRLTFIKRNPAAQDKMSIFDGGVLQVEKAAAGPVLHYRLTSRALLYCFLAPLLFLGFAQVTITLGKLEAASTEAASSKERKKDDVVRQLHPIDIALGAPAPEKPKKDKGKDDKKHSPTAAYFFAAIFATLYVVGRILEDWLFKRLLRRKLLG